MAKLNELKIQHLKKELEQRGLLTSGNKAELQARLREAMAAEGVDVDEYVFQLEAEELSTKVEEKAEPTGTSPGIDMSVMMAAMSQMQTQMQSQMSQISSHISSEMQSQMLQMSSQMSGQISSQISSEISSAISSAISTQSAEMASQMSQISMKIDGKLEKQDTRISKLEAEKSHMVSKMETIETEMDAVKTHMNSQLGTIEAEVDAVKTRLCELQLNRPTMSAGGPKVKAPSFDGSVPFPIFKLQFETTATANHWSTTDKVAALVVSLKGSAAEVLQAVPEADRGNYGSLMAAIERRYGSDHRQQMFQMELTSRCQRTNETLQEYATEIERLAHLAYAKETADFVEKMKCQAFIRGIRDSDTKRAAYSTPKGTFAETVSFALTQETAALLSKPVHKVHRIEVEEPTSLEETIRKIIRESSSQMPRQSSSVKCYNCGKTGHMARNCSIPRSQPMKNQGGRKRSAETGNDAPNVQQPLN